MSTTLARGLSPVRERLANGAIALVQQTSMAPAVTINASLLAGSVYEPPGLTGIANFMGRVLDRGTERRPADVIAEELDELGVALRITNTRHLLAVSCTCLAEDFDRVLDIIADVAQRPTFPEVEIAKRRAEVITAVRQDEDNPAVRAVDALSELLYGPAHPYGRRAKGTIETLERIQRQDLVDYYTRRVGPRTLSLAIVGDVQPEAAIERVARELEGWMSSTFEVVDVSTPPIGSERRERRIDIPGKSQTDIAYGFTAVRRLDPRYYAYWMMNNILGQFGLGGRLGDNIRERQGMAYYAFSALDANVGEGPLVVRAGVDPANVSRALDAIDHEVARMGREGATASELEETRAYLIGSIPRMLETNQSIAIFLQTSELFALGLDYDRRLPERLRAVTMDEVGAAAAEVLQPERAAVVIAGPPSVPSVS